MTALEFPRSLSICSRFISQLILITVCLCAAALVIEVSAQTVPSRPVARLVTSTSDEVSFPRPRRVSAGSARRSEVPSPAAFPSINHATETERKAFEATNEMRANNGVSPLSWDAELCRMARAHSEKMARLGFFAHETPEGSRLKDRARTARIRFQVIGENIAYNQDVDDPGTFAVQRWMISSGHRANILSREFRSSGIGSFVAENGRVYLTQIFIAP
ncbi:MAG: CAP domain-containing protein [Pyrinomonadaceae bacterium]|nr:CAP domain-containing protein [Pyrinomonadaceae bacterium]